VRDALSLRCRDSQCAPPTPRVARPDESYLNVCFFKVRATELPDSVSGRADETSCLLQVGSEPTTLRLLSLA